MSWWKRARLSEDHSFDSYCDAYYVAIKTIKAINTFCADMLVKIEEVNRYAQTTTFGFYKVGGSDDNYEFIVGWESVNKHGELPSMLINHMVIEAREHFMNESMMVKGHGGAGRVMSGNTSGNLEPVPDMLTFDRQISRFNNLINQLWVIKDRTTNAADRFLGVDMPNEGGDNKAAPPLPTSVVARLEDRLEELNTVVSHLTGQLNRLESL